MTLSLHELYSAARICSVVEGRAGLDIVDGVYDLVQLGVGGVNFNRRVRASLHSVCRLF